MTEDEYVRATNLAKVSAALRLVADLTSAGLPASGMTHPEWQRTCRVLDSAERRLRDSLDIEVGE